MFSSIKKAVQNWRVGHQTKDELSRLSDEQLADIGLTRGDVARVSRNVYAR